MWYIPLIKSSPLQANAKMKSESRCPRWSGLSLISAGVMIRKKAAPTRWSRELIGSANPVIGTIENGVPVFIEPKRVKTDILFVFRVESVAEKRLALRHLDGAWG